MTRNAINGSFRSRNPDTGFDKEIHRIKSESVESNENETFHHCLMGMIDVLPDSYGNAVVFDGECGESACADTQKRD